MARVHCLHGGWALLWREGACCSYTKPFFDPKRIKKLYFIIVYKWKPLISIPKNCILPSVAKSHKIRRLHSPNSSWTNRARFYLDSIPFSSLNHQSWNLETGKWFEIRKIVIEIFSLLGEGQTVKSAWLV